MKSETAKLETARRLWFLKLHSSLKYLDEQLKVIAEMYPELTEEQERVFLVREENHKRPRLEEDTAVKNKK